MKRQIHFDTLAPIGRVFIPHQGLSIDIDGFSAEIVGICGWSTSEEENVDLTKDIAGDSYEFSIGAVGIAEAVELIEDWLKENPEKAEYHIKNPVVF